MYTPHGGVYSLCLKLHMIRIRERGPLPYNRESDSPVGEGFPLPNFVFVIFILHFALCILHLHSARRSVPLVPLALADVTFSRDLVGAFSDFLFSQSEFALCALNSLKHTFSEICNFIFFGEKNDRKQTYQGA